MFRRLLPLTFAVFAIGTDSFVVAGVLPDVAGSLHVGVGSAGQMVTAYSLAYAICSPLIAVLAARWTRNRVLLTGLTVFILANVATALAPDFALVIVFRILAGVGAAAVTPGATVAGASLAPPEKRAQALSIVTAGLSVATALGAPLGTFIGSHFGWRSTMWFVAAVGALAAVGTAAFLQKIPAPPAVPWQRRLAPLGNPRIALTLLGSLLFFTGNYVINTYISQVFHRATDGNGTTLAVLLLASGIAGAIGSFASGPLTDRLGNRGMIVIAALVAAVDFAVTPWAGAALGTAFAAVIVWGLSGFSLIVPLQHRLITISPADAQLSISLNSSVIFVGASLAGVVGAAGLDLVGGENLGFIGAAFFVAGLIVAELTHVLIRRHNTAAERVAAAGEPQTAGT
ncbi:MFS transporter [Streptantibioticus cattleyicolor]|uniref:Major facilitator superfamily transporter DHA1 family protein n=1 Tax=Streptantibioticus cattleyicolor (strain ATCC 35852 / DSM 46488 / JCM 4925 / NBRC 14057 / NRRL 8057) TaxID=1003195 RepID=F8JKS1_STREN|nr:MFS transporter [Streptantibioticus cattleyicolor]AEW98434.1 major facilitator superfamily transporter DHA1 family protein [Streptantibioticus cattleyicolor NRRL 8057 = DSM 46488]CCB72510.1 MFS transporter, DHA1 family [Streptantibioticus cattleyicolor NRRL 8057 = DSM 46488]